MSPSEAELVINTLKKDTLVIVIPTYQDKERILMAAKKKARGKTYKKSTNQKLVKLYASRQLETEALINAFENNYSFSQVLYIPDSLVSKFESGIERTYFIDPNTFRINRKYSLSNRSPIKLLKQHDQEWHIKIKTKLIPNPFPNYYLYRNGLYGFLGTESYDKMYTRVASVFQRRFTAFYSDPTSRISL